MTEKEKYYRKVLKDVVSRGVEALGMSLGEFSQVASRPTALEQSQAEVTRLENEIKSYGWYEKDGKVYIAIASQDKL